MWKTPEETKKGLECCYSAVEPMMRCEQCPYYGSIVCKMHLHADSIDIIQQLQTENAEKNERIRQLEAERDAAVKDLEDYATLKCFACKYYEMELTEAPCDECKIMGKGKSDMFEWRGVLKEE